MQDKNNQFEYLMINHLSGNISDKEERVLLDILNSDPQYKLLYSEMAKTRAISFTPEIESQKTSNYQILLNKINQGLLFNNRPNFFTQFARIAAIIIFIISTSISTYYLVQQFSTSNKQLMSYETIVPHGSQTKIILPDGTEVWLNSGSKLKYDNSYGNKNRTVHLTGEGYFKVKKNANAPFFVYLNRIQVKVLGTVFNARSYVDESTVEVNLLEGKIDICKDNGVKTIASLLPDENLIFDKKSGEVQSYKVDASRSSLWTTGRLCFVDASLADIAKDLERKFDVHININSKQIKEELFSGSLDLNQQLEKILDYIDVDKKYNKIYNGKTITITNH
ncbi:MAG: FecR family protein [Paludibacter sp.]|nr:FecR family protein [Paludibacter sp.]